MKRNVSYGDVALGVECAFPAAPITLARAAQRSRPVAGLAGQVRRLAVWLNGRFAPRAPRR